MSIVNNAIIDNISISNECDGKGENGEIDDFDLLDIDFHNTNEINIANNDTFSPSIRNTKITDTDNTSPKQKGWNYTREEEIVLCRSFINLSKNSIGTEKNWKYSGEMCIRYFTAFLYCRVTKNWRYNAQIDGK